MPYLTARLQGFGTTIFAEMSALAVATGSVNLGQGFPDYPGPPEVLDVARAAIGTGANQYPPGPGMPGAARRRSPRTSSGSTASTYDPDAEVLVTAGATEALAGALLALLDTGDEVVLFEPMYDSYAAGIALAGGVARPVPLRPPADGAGPWTFDPDELRAAITPRTKLLLLNTPHNPTGKVFTADELPLIAELAIEHDLLVLTDEVYEHLVFGGARHVSIATLPGMRERTLRRQQRRQDVQHDRLEDRLDLRARRRWSPPSARPSSSSPTSTAARSSRRSPPGSACPTRTSPRFARDLEYRARRPGRRACATAGLPVISPEATYFATVDIRPVQPDGDGLAFCRALPERAGVVAVPTEVFYDPAHAHWAGTWCGSRSASATRCSTRPSSGWLRGTAHEDRRGAARHRLGGPRRQLRAARPAGRRRRRRRRRAGAAHRDVLHRLLHDAGHRRARGRPVVAVPRRPGRRARRVGGRHVPGDRRTASDAARTTPSCSPGPTARRTATARSTRSPTAASTSASGPGRSR